VLLLCNYTKKLFFCEEETGYFFLEMIAKALPRLLLDDERKKTSVSLVF
jgi:hypothetical protein